MAGCLLPVLSDVPVGSYGRPLCYEDKGLAVPGRRKVSPSWGDELYHPGSTAVNPTLLIFGLNRFCYADRCTFVPKSFNYLNGRIFYNRQKTGANTDANFVSL
jgi:hypothetical protein